jgi:hypothetical protein
MPVPAEPYQHRLGSGTVKTYDANTGFLVRSYSPPYLMKHGTNQAIRIKLHTYTAIPALTPTLLGWGGSSSSGDTSEYVMDLATTKIWRVGAARGCSEVILAGAYASWHNAKPDGQCGGQIVVRWRSPTMNHQAAPVGPVLGREQHDQRHPVDPAEGAGSTPSPPARTTCAH